MPCEICGKAGGLVRAKIEGSFLRVCRACARFGEVVPETTVASVPIRRGTGRKIRYEPRPIESERVLITDYGKVVRHARESRSLSQKDLAQKLNERESIVRQIEHEHIRPDEKTVGKLEKFLGIKLMGEAEEADVEEVQASETTLADVAKIRKR